MFNPKSFRIDDTRELVGFMRRYSFCSLITSAGEKLSISHVPVLVDENDGCVILTGHLAAANPHAASLNGNRSTAIFHGPHSYVSPAWYINSEEVPTWNYASVHAIGQARTFKDAVELSRLVDRMIETYESQQGSGWDRQLPQDYRSRQIDHIVGFVLRVEKLEGKYKLGQNRSQADQDKMLDQLESSEQSDSRLLADFIKRFRRRSRVT